MRVIRSWVAATFAGASVWSATEYGLHRFALHEMRGRGPASVKHLEHHADVTTFAPVPRKLVAAAATSAVLYPVTAIAAPRRWAAAFTAGFVGAYLGYEAAHRRTHAARPRTRYGRWARRNHLYHHFGAPMRNFGVTNPVWDRAFGTYDEPGVVTVPRRMAPAWLVDASGEVRSEFAAGYRIVGTASRGTRSG